MTGIRFTDFRLKRIGVGKGFLCHLFVTIGRSLHQLESRDSKREEAEPSQDDTDQPLVRIVDSFLRTN